MRKLAGAAVLGLLALAGLLPSRAPAATGDTPIARVGAYYFDGWAGSFSGFHFTGLRGGPFEERRPLFGWSDRPRTTMPTQLRWAADTGLDFFVFDWYWHAHATAYPYLNRGLDNYRATPTSERAGVGFAIAYVNVSVTDAAQALTFPDAPATPPGADFVIPRSRWSDQVRSWSRLFRSPDYARVGGRALFVILDAGGFIAQWGGIAGANRAISALHRAGAFVASAVSDASGLAAVARLHLDALTQYSYPLAAPPRPGPRPWGELAAATRGLWASLVRGPLPLIPAATTGWNPRPWREYQAGQLFWFQRRPSQVASLLRSAIGVARGENLAHPPLALLSSWNELGEGHYIVPTVGTRFSYLKAVARALRVPWTGR